MKIGIAQINAVIGDFPGNAKRILAAYRACCEAGADLVITPEMSLIGYPPRDLILKSNFIPQCLQALDYLADEAKMVPLIVGYVDNNEDKAYGKAHYNSAAVLHHGKVLHRTRKTLLPTYDVFDEARYFEPSEQSEPFIWQGKRIGITICEDIWQDLFVSKPLYLRDPVEELVAQKIDFLLNLSASPFQLGKPSVRQNLVQTISRNHHLPVVYCNAVGANDQLIFDGNSIATDCNGNLIAELKAFDEATCVIDLSENTTISARDVNDAQEIFQALVLGLRDYAHKSGFQSACLGLSGGIDSALTAAIAVEALGAENVVGMTMPSQFSSEGSVSDSMALAQHLKIRCHQVPIAPAFEAIKASLAPVFEGKKEDVTEENLQARIRGVFLMALSNKHGHLLLTTGNKSELAVGYCTMYGDMCGGLAVISDLPKMKVYEVSRWLNREREVIPWNTIEKAPSAELRPNQKDQDSLPEYDILDGILELYVERQLCAEEIIAQGFEESTVRWIQRRVDLNEWKRHQAAPGLRVTSKAFGIGRRMPIVQKFQN